MCLRFKSADSLHVVGEFHNQFLPLKTDVYGVRRTLYGLRYDVHVRAHTRTPPAYARHQW